MTQTTNTNSDALRASMRDLHTEIEQHPLQRQLASAEISRADYARYLKHLHSLHSSLEGRLQELGDKEPFNRVVQNEHYQKPFLERDLDRLKPAGEDVTPLAETAQFGRQGVFAENDIALLGALYVLLGSKHGGKYMANQLRTAWGAEDRHEYLDPYGPEFSGIWKKFVAELNTVDQQEALLAGAKETYNAFFAISNAVKPE